MDHKFHKCTCMCVYACVCVCMSTFFTMSFLCWVHVHVFVCVCVCVCERLCVCVSVCERLYRRTQMQPWFMIWNNIERTKIYGLHSTNKIKFCQFFCCCPWSCCCCFSTALTHSFLCRFILVFLVVGECDFLCCFFFFCVTKTLFDQIYFVFKKYYFIISSKYEQDLKSQ